MSRIESYWLGESTGRVLEYEKNIEWCYTLKSNYKLKIGKPGKRKTAKIIIKWKVKTLIVDTNGIVPTG
jgi:hypothetical protein